MAGSEDIAVSTQNVGAHAAPATLQLSPIMQTTTDAIADLHGSGRSGSDSQGPGQSGASSWNLGNESSSRKMKRSTA